MSIVIKAENLSKAYQIGQIGTGTISRDIERWFLTTILGREDPFLKLGQVNDRTIKGETDVVWSLKDIDLNIHQGEAIGIIGKNGAGKSTLLKLLSRVTAPTAGRIRIKGRVASLLEVGTGFHPELTGRENVYLNGSILGMRKREIDRKLDEIIDFSGVERYIDTPTKRYSTGMYVRLAFAVAAHLESEILIVDEVLAVGDFEFQKKCIGKMDEVSSKDGRTILFVSHNMGAVQELCQRGIHIDKGKIQYEGEISDCIGNYYQLEPSVSQSNNTGRERVTFGTIEINGSRMSSIRSDEGITISLDFASHEIEDPLIIVIVESSLGHSIVHASVDTRKIGLAHLNGKYTLNVELPPLWLSPGLYSVYSKIISRIPKGRFLSERATLTVTGQYDKTGKTLLTPTVKWGLCDANGEPGQFQNQNGTIGTYGQA